MIDVGSKRVPCPNDEHDVWRVTRRAGSSLQYKVECARCDAFTIVRLPLSLEPRLVQSTGVPTFRAALKGDTW